MDRRIHLESERLILREFEKNDWKAACAWLCDATVMNFFGKPLTADSVKTFIKLLCNASLQDNRASFQLALVLRKDNLAVGDFALFLDQAEWHPHHAVLGYRLAQKYWEQGIGTEGVELLLRLGFEELELRKVSAGTSVNNPASSRVLEKNGMRREGCLKEHHFINGVWHDELTFGILSYDWHNRGAQKGS